MHKRNLLGARLSIALAVAVIALGCAPAASVPQAASGAPNAGAIVGRLTMVVGLVGDTRCYWLVTADGQKHGAVWPFGTTVHGDGLRVPTPTGVLAVSDGQQVWVVGGVGEGPGDVGLCASGDTIHVGSVSTTDPAAGVTG